MKIITLGLVSVLWAANSALSAIPFDEILGEETEALFIVHSLSETRDAVVAHPFYETFQDESVLEFFGKISGGGKKSGPDEQGFMEVLNEEFGLTLDELFELFPQQAAFASFNISESMILDEGYPDMAIMLEYAGEPEKLDELLQVQFERNAAAQKKINPAMEHELKQESFMGETLYLDEAFDGVDTYVEDGYCLVDGIFVLASPEDRLRSIVEAIKDGQDAPLSENDGYLRSLESAGKGPGFAVYFNLERLMPPLSKLFIDGMMESGGLATYGVTSLSLEKALSLNALLSLYIRVGLEADGIGVSSNLIHSGKDGLLSLVSYENGALPEARYIPEDALSASVSLFDLGMMLSNLEALLNIASPALTPLIDIQMQNIQQQTGIDLRSAILENLGSELVNFTLMEESPDELIIPSPQQFYLLEIKDADSLGRALETLKDLVPGGRAYIEEQAFEGQTIFTVKTPQAPNPHVDPEMRFSYVITRSALVIGFGKIGNLQKILTDMSDSSAEGIFQKPEVEQLLERIAQPQAVSQSYADLSAFIGPAVKSLAGTGVFGNKNSGLEIPEILSDSFTTISETNETKDGFFSRALLISKDK
ncbi:MAG: hypothetical protein AAGH40_04440 [Verrucomicrobiota bacterium]